MRLVVYYPGYSIGRSGIVLLELKAEEVRDKGKATYHFQSRLDAAAAAAAASLRLYGNNNNKN